MARIALVQCPLWDVTVPPSGIASLSSYLKMKGHQVTMFDFNVELYQENKDYFEPFLSGVSNQPGLLQMWEETEAFRENPVVTERTLKCWTERILAFEPDLVGFSAYNTTIHTCLHIARQLKEEHKDITIVFGGASCFQEHYTRAILSTGAVAAIVRGEGEIAFDRIAQAQEPSFCPGTILFMDGRHVDCGDAELVQNLDAIPFPDFESLPLQSYFHEGKFLSISFSRGCIAKCTFCVETNYWKIFRQRSAKNLFAEFVRNHDRFGTQSYRFSDSLINANVKEMEKLCDLIIGRKLPLHWTSFARIDTRLTVGLLRKLKLAGCERLDFGIESAAPAVLKAINKGYTPDSIRSTLRNAQEAGLDSYTLWMVGFPTESRMDFLRTLVFIARNRKLIRIPPPGPSVCTVSQGSLLHQRSEHFGVDAPDTSGWSTLDGKNTPAERLRRLRLFRGFTRLVGVWSPS